MRLLPTDGMTNDCLRVEIQGFGFEMGNVADRVGTDPPTTPESHIAARANHIPDTSIWMDMEAAEVA